MSVRGRFIAGAACATVATLAARSTGAGSGARSGPWCRDLTKIARENIYDFDLDTLDGKDKTFTLSKLEGRVVWLNFFTSWCPPCNAEAADIVRIGAKYGETLAVVGISVKETPDPVREFRKRHRIPYTIALDDTGAVFKSLGFIYYPTHVFIDARGYISCISIGDLTPEQMDNEVSVALDRAPLAKGLSAPVPTPTPKAADTPLPEPTET